MLPRLAPGPASRAQPPRFTGNAPRAHEKKKAKVMCAGRESNSGLVRGRDVYYHCTTGADVVVCQCALHSAGPNQSGHLKVQNKGADGPRTGSYGAMAARWIPDPKVGGSNPSSFTPFFRPFFFQSTMQTKKKVHCRNWESHPGCRGHNAESCY